MLTPKLEELILCGRAFFKTAVVGGSKTTIDIDIDRYIIITDITFLPYHDGLTSPGLAYNVNTQLSIYGERGFNHYMFANSRPYTQQLFGLDGNVYTFRNAASVDVQKIDCYILHTTQVGFSFLVDKLNAPIATNAVAAYNNPAYELPIDYGKDGMPGAIAVDDVISWPAMENRLVKRAGGLGVGSVTTEQVQLPADPSTKPTVDGNKWFPIANINYVEILGQPNNIGI